MTGQLEVLANFLQNWKGNSSFSDQLNPSDQMSGRGKYQSSTDMEVRLKSIDYLRLQIEQFVDRIKLVYRNGAQVKQVIKKLRETASIELRKCDSLRNDLLALTTDAHWTSAFKAGEYHMERNDCIPRVKKLKVQIKDIDRQISKQRKKNMKLSDTIVESMSSSC